MPINRRKLLLDAAAAGICVPAIVRAQTLNTLSAGSSKIVSGASATPLLNQLSAVSAVAYSTRLLRTAYAGSALQIQRSSDNTTQDIGFDGSGNLDTAAMATFVGSDTGTISKWYDQSGNGTYGVDAVKIGGNGTGALLTSSGVLQTQNSHAAPTMVNNANAMKFLTPALLNQPDSICAVVKITSASNSNAITDALSFFNGRQLIRIGSSQFEFFAGNDVAGGTPDTSIHGQIVIFNGASSFIYQDNSSVLTGNIGTLPMEDTDGGGQGLGCGSAIGSAINGLLPEFIVFTSALGSSDRGLITTDWATYWGTP